VGCTSPSAILRTRASACGLGNTLLTRAVPCTPEFHPACRLSGIALDAVLGDMEKLFFKTHFEIFHTATWHRHNQGRYTCARISSLVLLSLVPHTARHAAWFLHRMGPNYTGVTKDLSGFVSGISPHAPVDSCKRNTLGPVARSSPRFDL
jgi:hypothetical protein